jgi:hypothetical protein
MGPHDSLAQCGLDPRRRLQAWCPAAGAASAQPAMMRGVPIPSARGTGLRALAGAGLWVLTGCGVIIEEPQYDTRAEQRPGTWVSRLQSDLASLQGAYEDMIVKATPAQRRRLPSVGSELSRLSDATASMKDDLDWKRGHFGEHLAKAESVATSIDQQLSGAPVTSVVRSYWWDTAYALGIVREFYRELGVPRLYEVQDDPRGVVKLRTSSAKSEVYDASFEVDQVRRGYDQMMKSWRDAPARRGGRGLDDPTRPRARLAERPGQCPGTRQRRRARGRDSSRGARPSASGTHPSARRIARGRAAALAARWVAAAVGRGPASRPAVTASPAAAARPSTPFDGSHRNLTGGKHA